MELEHFEIIYNKLETSSDPDAMKICTIIFNRFIHEWSRPINEIKPIPKPVLDQSKENFMSYIKILEIIEMLKLLIKHH